MGNSNMPEGYDRAMQRARDIVADQSIHYETNVTFALALLYAHSQRRTEGAVEVCSLCGAHADNWPGTPTHGNRCNAFEHVEEEKPCPIKRGGEGA